MAQQVNTRPILPLPSAGTVSSLSSWATTTVKQLLDYLTTISLAVNEALPKDGTRAMTGPLPLAVYTQASLPSASANPHTLIYVSDAATGSKIQYSDGSTWIAIG